MHMSDTTLGVQVEARQRRIPPAPQTSPLRIIGYSNPLTAALFDRFHGREMVEKVRAKVLTRFWDVGDAQPTVRQGFLTAAEAEKARISSLCIRQSVPEPASSGTGRRASKGDRTERVRRTGDRGQTSRKGARSGKGSRKGSTCLTWDEVLRLDGLAHAARTAGLPLNAMLTVRTPLGASDAEGRRVITLVVGHVGQRLQRLGQDHLGITVCEKDRHLHAHHLFHVRRQNYAIVQAWADARGHNLCPADRHAVEYITKQRKWMGPEAERSIKCRWVPSAHIAVNKRWSATGPILALERARAPAPAATVPESGVIASARPSRPASARSRHAHTRAA